MKKKLFALSGVLMVALVVSGLWATRAINLAVPQQTVEPAATTVATGMTMQEMTTGASLIVTGKCLETRSQWIERRLVTLATVAVTEEIKGDAAETIVVELPGGIDSNRKHPVSMTYAGAPQIALDEEVFLFLSDQNDVPNGYVVMGFAQGKFSINEDDAGEKVVSRDLTGVRMQKGVGMTRGNLQLVPLSEFKERVRSFLR